MRIEPEVVDAVTERGDEVALFVYHLPCGCRTLEHPRRSPWVYRPQWWFPKRWWLPVGLGSDEWCRRTLALGWPLTGFVVIPMSLCRGCVDCGPHWLNGVSNPS